MNMETVINKHYYLLISTIYVLVITFLLLYSNLFFQYTMDDSYISFRYANNFADGYGLVFNINELPRSEGLTSPLYALVLSIGVLGSYDLVIYSKLFGLLLLTLILLIIIKSSKLFYRQYDFMNEKIINILSILPALVYISDPYTVANAISGMETMFGTLLFLLFIYWYLKITLNATGNKPNMAILGFLAFLVPLARPELTLGVMSLLVLSFILLPSLRKELSLSIGIFIILGVIYFLWRYNYYELLLPLPFYIKQGTKGLPGFGDVIGFFSHYFLQLSLLLASTIIILKKQKNYTKIFFIILATITIQLSYYFFIHHIMGFGYRYFQPLIPIIILLGTFSIPFLARQEKVVFSLQKELIFLYVLIIIFFNVFSYKKAYEIYIDWYTGENKIFQISKVLTSVDHNYSIAINDCGELPYYTKWKTVDLAGLNNRNIALGHSRKATIEELKKRNVDLIVLVGKKEHGKLFGWERVRKQDITNLGYSYLGNLALSSDYHWLLYGKNTQKYGLILDPLQDYGLLKVKR